MGSWVKGKRGDWLVKAAPGQAGQTVDVARRNGAVASITLGREVWSGEGRALYTVAYRGPAVAGAVQASQPIRAPRPQPVARPVEQDDPDTMGFGEGNPEPDRNRMAF